MVEIENYTDGLIERNGILYAESKSEISYPDDGNNICFQIEENSFWFRHRNNCIVEAVKKYAPSSDFFDVGGGNGFVTKALEENGIQSILVEPGADGCLNAQKRSVKHIICSTLENALFKKDRIPAIGLFDVVEHIENDKAFLQSIYAFLKPDGYVFITVPAFYVLWSNEDKDAGHYRRYTLNTLEDKLKLAGFTIEYATYIFCVLPAPIFLFRTITSRLGFNKKSNDPEKHKHEHEAKKSVLQKILNKIWRYELRQISAGKKIPFGSSCFVVARK